jgi:hypothetical protein
MPERWSREVPIPPDRSTRLRTFTGDSVIDCGLDFYHAVMPPPREPSILETALTCGRSSQARGRSFYVVVQQPGVDSTVASGLVAGTSPASPDCVPPIRPESEPTMLRRLLADVPLTIVLAAGAILSSISPAWACGCTAGGSLASAVRAAGVVIVADVTSVTVLSRPVRMLPNGAAEGGTPLGEVVHLTVSRAYKGDVPPAFDLRTSGGSDCEIGFEQGETWMIYGVVADGQLHTSKCSRTRLLAHASQDVAYLEGVAVGRPQGVVYGVVLRRALWQGRVQLIGPDRFTPLLIAAQSSDRRIEASADWSSYQIVLPPGPATLWVELNGRPVMDPIAVDVSDRGEQRAMLIVEYP